MWLRNCQGKIWKKPSHGKCKVYIRKFLLENGFFKEGISLMNSCLKMGSCRNCKILYTYDKRIPFMIETILEDFNSILFQN